MFQIIKMFSNQDGHKLISFNRELIPAKAEYLSEYFTGPYNPVPEFQGHKTFTIHELNRHDAITCLRIHFNVYFTFNIAALIACYVAANGDQSLPQFDKANRFFSWLPHEPMATPVTREHMGFFLREIAVWNFLAKKIPGASGTICQRHVDSMISLAKTVLNELALSEHLQFLKYSCTSRDAA